MNIELRDLLEDIPLSVDIEVYHAVSGKYIPESDWLTTAWVVITIRPLKKDRMRISVI